MFLNLKFEYLNETFLTIKMKVRKEKLRKENLIGF